MSFKPAIFSDKRDKMGILETKCQFKSFFRLFYVFLKNPNSQKSIEKKLVFEAFLRL